MNIYIYIYIIIIRNKEELGHIILRKNSMKFKKLKETRETREPQKTCTNISKGI